MIDQLEDLIDLDTFYTDYYTQDYPYCLGCGDDLEPDEEAFGYCELCQQLDAWEDYHGD